MLNSVSDIPIRKDNQAISFQQTHSDLVNANQPIFFPLKKIRPSIRIHPFVLTPATLATKVLYKFFYA